MGYSTDFNGTLSLSRTLTDTEKDYINTFSGTRRMKRNVEKLMELYKGEHGFPLGTTNLLPASEGLITEMVENTNGKFVIPNRTALEIYGSHGEFFTKDDGDFGQTVDGTIIDYNKPPVGSPGLWCQWIINDNNELEWNGGEKFYSYVEWLNYMVNKFFKPWGVLLNGEIDWYGEERSDVGKIVVVNNVVKTTTYPVN